MKHFPNFNLIIPGALLLILGLIPTGAAAGDDDGISMIVASDPQFYCIEMPKDSAILRNQLAAQAWNNILDLDIWPAQSSRLSHGYDAPVVHPSGVIVNGDLVHTFMKNKHQAFIEWRNSIQYPMYPGLGNHDMLDSGFYDNLVFIGYWKKGWGDYTRSPKEAMWWMANLIEKGHIPNIVNRDLNGFVGLRNELLTSKSRIGIRFWMIMPPNYEDSMFVITWSDPIPSQAVPFVSHWGFVRIPDRAVQVLVQKKRFGQWVNVRSFPVPEPWQAQCYRVYPGFAGPKAETRSRPREWPDGNIGSLAYSYDIGPYYHFVQLHNGPTTTPIMPERKLSPLAIANVDDAFYCFRSPALELTSSIEWLKEDLAAATEAGKYIIIN